MDSIGISSVTGADDVFVVPQKRDAERLGIQRTVSLLVGDMIRDHFSDKPSAALWPYNSQFQVLPEDQIPALIRVLWPCKAVISTRRRFGVRCYKGARWYESARKLYYDKLRSPLSITFAFVATHNHFVFDRGNKVFNGHTAGSSSCLPMPRKMTTSPYWAYSTVPQPASG